MSKWRYVSGIEVTEIPPGSKLKIHDGALEYRAIMESKISSYSISAYRTCQYSGCKLATRTYYTDQVLAYKPPKEPKR